MASISMGGQVMSCIINDHRFTSPLTCVTSTLFISLLSFQNQSRTHTHTFTHGVALDDSQDQLKQNVTKDIAKTQTTQYSACLGATAMCFYIHIITFIKTMTRHICGQHINICLRLSSHYQIFTWEPDEQKQTLKWREHWWIHLKKQKCQRPVHYKNLQSQT